MKKLRFLSIVLACIYAFCFSSVACFAETDEIMYGDANCDNEVDIRDVTALNQHLVGMNELSEQGIKNCDFFCDNEITVQSLLNLKKNIIRTVSSLEPLTYYQITDEEIQEYIEKYNIPDNLSETDGILFEVTDMEQYNTNFDLYISDLPVYIHEFPESWKLVSISPEYKNKDSLARIIYCIEKDCDYLKFYDISTLEG